MVERTSIHQPAASFKRFKHVLTTSSSAVAFAAFVLAASVATNASVLAQSNTTGAVTPISEDEFINPTGLGLLSGAIAAPYEIENLPNSAVSLSNETNSVAGSPTSYIEALGNSGDDQDMAALDEAIPGMHTPALPASMNPALSSSASNVSVSAFGSGATPLPAAFIDTTVQSADEFQSASLSANRVEPSSDIQINSDLAIPPAAMAENLPDPYPMAIEAPDARVNVPTTVRNARTSPSKDLAFVTEKLDSVGINSQKLRGRIGTGLIARPDYLGSDDTEVNLIPVIDLEYMDRVFVSTERGVGVNLFSTDRFDSNVFGTWRRGRKAEGDIKTFQDRNGSAALGLEVGSRFGPFRASINTDFGVTGDMKGAKADLDLDYSQAIGSKLNAKLGFGLRAADSTYMDSVFGVSAADVSAGAPTITQSSDFSAGLVDLHGGLDAAYYLTPNISLNFGLGASILTGDAAKSQIVEELGSKTQWNTTISTQFKF